MDNFKRAELDEKIHDVMVPELEFMFVYNDGILDMEIYNVETE